MSEDPLARGMGETAMIEVALLKVIVASMLRMMPQPERAQALAEADVFVVGLSPQMQATARNALRLLTERIG